LKLRRIAITIELSRETNTMKSILDSSFRYTPSVDTDVRKTFERIRRELQSQAGLPDVDRPEVSVKVVQLDQLKKAS
jgi:hypothetical protein